MGVSPGLTERRRDALPRALTGLAAAAALGLAGWFVFRAEWLGAGALGALGARLVLAVVEHPPTTSAMKVGAGLFTTIFLVLLALRLLT